MHFIYLLFFVLVGTNLVQCTEDVVDDVEKDQDGNADQKQTIIFGFVNCEELNCGTFYKISR